MKAKPSYLQALHLQSGTHGWMSPVLASLVLHGSLLAGGVALWTALSDAPRDRTEPVKILLLEPFPVDTGEVPSAAEAAPIPGHAEPEPVPKPAVVSAPVAVAAQHQALSTRSVQARTTEQRVVVDVPLVTRRRPVREPVMPVREPVMPVREPVMMDQPDPVHAGLAQASHPSPVLVGARQEQAKPGRSATVAGPLIEGHEDLRQQPVAPRQAPTRIPADQVVEEHAARTGSIMERPGSTVVPAKPAISNIVNREPLFQEVLSSVDGRAAGEPSVPKRPSLVKPYEVAKLPAFTSRLDLNEPETDRQDGNTLQQTPREQPIPAGLAPRSDYGWVAQVLWDRIGQFKRYPYVARMNRWEGTVVVHGVVKANGELDRLRLEASSGHHILDEDALDLLRKVSPLVLPRDLGRSELPLRVPITYKLH